MVMSLYKIKMAVRQLVEYLYQSGDLSQAFLSVERANLGSRIHRKIQKAAGDQYQSEVFLKDETTMDDITFIIEGRADGIVVEDEHVLIDEIKSTAIPYDEIEPVFVHWAQVYCYCYFYMKQEQIEHITAQLTYVQIDNDAIKQFQKEFTFKEIETFYLDMLQSYIQFAKQMKDFEVLRDESIQNLTFPFPGYREGQREFAVSVYRSIQEKKELYAMAPTGIGKTISTLFPSIKSIYEFHTEKIFYLCAKNITATVAIDTMNLLYHHGLRLKCVSLTAKDKMCLMEERNCDPEVCPYAKGYYDRLNPAVKELLEQRDIMDKEIFFEYGKKHTLCPFELSLDMSLYADLIICDYNYVFDPQVFLKRFMMEGGDFVFLVDEVHNLVDRARSMYSKELQKQKFLDMKRIIEADENDLRKAMTRVNSSFLELRKLMEDHDTLISEEPFYDFINALNVFINACDWYLQREHEKQISEQVKELYYEVLAYLRISEFYDENYVTILRQEGKELLIKQFCMDPHNQLQMMKKKGRNTIFFSATLTPVSYFTTLLGGNDESMKIRFPSPFHETQSCIIINDRISTRYRNRMNSIFAVVENIYTAVTCKKGNYIVFFPSYQYMQMVAQQFRVEYPDIFLCVQETGMNELEKEVFLNKFDDHSDTQVFFCVLGGMFAEGIDLKGSKLIGTIIVGVGLPQISDELDLIKKHFDESKQGYHYAYTFPGMNKVLQAAGRVIRTKNDKGIILFLDDRFTSPIYRSLIPPHFAHYKIIHELAKMKTEIERFWKENSTCM